MRYRTCTSRGEWLDNLKRENKEDAQAFSRAVIRKWCNMNSGPNQVKVRKTAKGDMPKDNDRDCGILNLWLVSIILSVLNTATNTNLFLRQVMFSVVCVIFHRTIRGFMGLGRGDGSDQMVHGVMWSMMEQVGLFVLQIGIYVIFLFKIQVFNIILSI